MNINRGLQEAYEAVYNQELRQNIAEKKEFENLVNEVFYTIAFSMVSEGKTIQQVVEFFAVEDVEVIVEEYHKCDIEKINISEDVFTSEFKDFITEAPNPILSPLMRQIQQAGGREASRGLGSGAARQTSQQTTTKTPNLAMQNLKALGGGLRNVATSAYLLPVMAVNKLRGQSVTGQAAKIAGLTPQQAVNKGALGTIGSAIETQGKKNVAGAVDFIKKKVAPIAAGSGVLGGTYAIGRGQGYGQGAYDKETEILRQRALGN